MRFQRYRVGQDRGYGRARCGDVRAVDRRIRPTASIWTSTTTTSYRGRDSAGRTAAESECRGDGGGSQKHDGAARHQDTSARSKRQRVRAEPRELRRGLANPYPESSRPLTLKSGKKVTTADIGGSSGALRSLKTSIAKCSDVCRRTCRRSPGASIVRSSRSWRPAGGRQGTDWQRRQLRISGSHRRHSDDARDAGQCIETGAGDDDVRRPIGMPPAPGTPPPPARGFGPGRGGAPVGPGEPPAPSDPWRRSN